jgi:hypothetical protein
MDKQTGYTPDIEMKMKRLFATLSEKDRRRYAAIEAAKLASGGIDAISSLFGLDAKTVRKGLTELELPDDPAASDFLANMRIVFDEHLPRWNYRAIAADA